MKLKYKQVSSVVIYFKFVEFLPISGANIWKLLYVRGQRYRHVNSRNYFMKRYNDWKVKQCYTVDFVRWFKIVVLCERAIKHHEQCWARMLRYELFMNIMLLYVSCSLKIYSGELFFHLQPLERRMEHRTARRYSNGYLVVSMQLSPIYRFGRLASHFKSVVTF